MPIYYFGTDGSGLNNKDNVRAGAGICIRKASIRKLSDEEKATCRIRINTVSNCCPDESAFKTMKAMFKVAEYSNCCRIVKDLINKSNDQYNRFMYLKAEGVTMAVNNKPIKLADLLKTAVDLRRLENLFKSMSIEPTYACYHCKVPLFEIKSLEIDNIQQGGSRDTIIFDASVEDNYMKGTNNRGEFTALITALKLAEYLNLPVGELNLITDSEWCMKHINGTNARKKNLDLSKIWFDTEKAMTLKGWVINIYHQRAHGKGGRKPEDQKSIEYIRYHLNELADTAANYKIVSDPNIVTVIN
jgi:ribonuclease HI